MSNIQTIQSTQSIQSTQLTINHNNKLSKGEIPNTVQHLTFCYYFNQVIEKDDLPNSIRHLVFTNYYYAKELNNLPSGLKSLKLISNHQILSNLPVGLEKLIIGYYNKANYIKIPYGCVCYDSKNNQIQI
jgi:hypothetical protein